MGYFDKLTESAFKEGDNGETIYFPNGVFGRGRLIHDPTRKAQLFKYHKRLNKYLIPLSVLYGMLLGLGGGLSVNGVMPLIITGIIVLIRQRYLMRGLPVLNEKLSVKEATAATSRNFHPALLLFMIGNGVFLVLLSLTIPFILDKPLNEIISLVLIPSIVGLVLIGISMYLYKIKVK